MTNGEYIKELRELSGLSQREIASLSGISSAEISRIESGERVKPTPSTLRKLAKPLEINYLELLVKFDYVESDILEGKIIIERRKPLSSFTTEELLMELLNRELGKE